MTDDSKTETATSAPATARGRMPHPVVIGALILLVAALVVTGPRLFRAFSSGAEPVAKPQGSIPVVVVDSRRIIDASLRALPVEGMTPEKASVAGKAFATKFNAVLESYRNAGFVVMNSATLLAWPGAMDVTEEVAKKVDVDLH